MTKSHFTQLALNSYTATELELIKSGEPAMFEQVLRNILMTAYEELNSLVSQLPVPPERMDEFQMRIALARDVVNLMEDLLKIKTLAEDLRYQRINTY